MDRKFLENIIILSSQSFGIEPQALYIKTRQADIKFARWFVWEIIIATQGITLERTATIFGNYDHTTIIHALDNLPIILETDSDLYFKYQALLTKAGVDKSLISKLRNKRFDRQKKKDGKINFISDKVLNEKMRRYKLFLETKAKIT